MSEAKKVDLRDHIRAIQDFPKEGILFRDITPLLANPDAFRETVRQLAECVSHLEIDAIAAAEARGFLFAAPLALELNVPLIPIRKPGKLPYDTMAQSYDLEYGTDTMEIHSDAVSSGDRVLVVDDLLATGGTIDACCRLIEQAGGNVVGCAFLIELVGLGGIDKIDRYDTVTLIQYEED